MRICDSGKCFISRNKDDNMYYFCSKLSTRILTGLSTLDQGWKSEPILVKGSIEKDDTDTIRRDVMTRRTQEGRLEVPFMTPEELTQLNSLEGGPVQIQKFEKGVKLERLEGHVTVIAPPTGVPLEFVGPVEEDEDPSGSLLQELAKRKSARLAEEKEKRKKRRFMKRSASGFLALMVAPCRATTMSSELLIEEIPHETEKVEVEDADGLSRRRKGKSVVIKEASSSPPRRSLITDTGEGAEVTLPPSQEEDKTRTDPSSGRGLMDKTVEWWKVLTQNVTL